MVLLRSVSKYRGYSEGRRRLGLTHDDPDSLCVLAQERGDHAFSYSLYPHIGTWRDSGVPSVAHSFNNPPICLPGITSREPEMSMLSAKPPEFEIVCVKAACDDLIVRGYDTSGLGCNVRMKLPFVPASVWVADLLENPIQPIPFSGPEIEFSCGPHEIMTLRVRQ